MKKEVQMKRKVFFVVMAVVMLVPFLVTGFVVPAEKKSMKIGFMTDLTGILSVNGIPNKEGAILAMEEAGYKVNGRPVELIVEDEASDPGVAMDKARKLVETNKICVLIGPHNAACASAVAAYVNKTQTPNITNSMGIAADVPLKNNWTWALWGTLRQLSYPMGAYAYDVLGIRTVTTMATDYVAGREFLGGFLDSFTERGGRIIQQQWIPLGTKDVSSYITALNEADALVPWFAGVTATVGVRQIKEFKVKMPVIMPQSQFPANPKQIAEIGDYGVGIITSDAYVWTLDAPGNKEFVERYKKRWGDVPASVSYYAYFAVQVALEALKKTGGDTSPAAIAKIFNDTTFNSLVGPVSFGPAHVPVANYVIHKVIKVGDKYRTEVLKVYRVSANVEGGKLIHRIVK
jgi:branched-chain amino acid transport system substrate-binding protein